MTSAPMSSRTYSTLLRIPGVSTSASSSQGSGREELDEEEERPVGMGENGVGVYQAVVIDSWSIGALGKSQST